MKTKRAEIGILVLLLVALFVLNYNFLDGLTKKLLDTSQEIRVDRVIDGDTIQSNRTTIRLLGINTPEKGEF